MSINEINVGDYVRANRDLPKKQIVEGQIGKVIYTQCIDSDFYLDIECKEKDGNEFFVYNSAKNCWNKVDKPEDIIESIAEESQPVSEEQPVPRVYKVPEPDWKEIESLAVEHADSGFGVAGSTELSYHSFTPESLKEFVMSVLEHVAENTEVRIPQPTVIVHHVNGGAGIQLHVGGGGAGGGFPQDSVMGCAVGRGWSVGGVQTNYGPGGAGVPLDEQNKD